MRGDSNIDRFGTRLVQAGRLALATGILAGSSVAFAQTLPPTREELQRTAPSTEDVETDPALSIDTDFDRAACPLADPQFADIRFTLSRADFVGMDGVDTAFLDGTWSELAGREIGIARVCDIRDRAAALLRAAGYVASVQVPPQTIDDGTVRFDVVLARLTNLVIRGDAGASGAVIEEHFSALRGKPHFKRDEAERILLLARDIPGLDARLALARDESADARPGDLVGIVDVRFRQIEADAALLNWNSRSTGRFGMSARMQFNGVTGLADLTELTAYSSFDPSEQVVVSGRHEFGIGGDGLRLGLSGVHAWSEPDVPGPNVFDSKTFIGTIYASYPIKRTQEETLAITGGFEWIDQDLDFSGVALSEDELRVAFLRLTTSGIDRQTLAGLPGYSLAEPKFSTFGQLEIRQGLDILGASEGCGAAFVNCLLPGAVPIGRLNADPTAFIIRGDALATYRPTPLVAITIKPRFQITPDALLSYEQFSGGNYTVGRGYDPGAVIGDSGLGSQLEFAYGSLIPEEPGGFAWQPFAFFDTFAAWLKDVPGDPFTLNSIGGGVRASYASRAYLELVGVVPLKRAPFQTEKGDPRLLVNLVVRLGQ